MSKSGAEAEHFAGEKAQERIIIKFKHLPEPVQVKIKELKAARRSRLLGSAGRGLLSGGLLCLVIMGAGRLGKYEEIVRRMFAVAASTGGSIFGALRAFSSFQKYGPKVAQKTKEVAEHIGIHGLVSGQHASKYSLPPRIRQTHPFVIVDARGNVHLLAKTTFEEELYAAQRGSNFGLRRRREKI